MKFIPTEIPEVIVIEPEVHSDKRGFFYESYRLDKFASGGIDVTFVQDNHSKSGRGTLRGLHFQKDPMAQAKLVRAVHGSIFDVAVDLRADSPSFGKWVGRTLSEENKQMLFIPAGFAHGFLVLEDNTEVLYKASEVYSPENEDGIIWSDEHIKIDWPKMEGAYIVSAKDGKLPGFDPDNFRT